jgi:hypothetical protein
MIKNKTEDFYTGIAFYDFQEQHIQWESLYNWLLGFILKHKQKPTRMILTAPFIKPSSKTKSFNHYNKLIRSMNYKDIYSFWIGAGYPDNPGGDQTDCSIGFDIDWRHKKCLTLYFKNNISQYNYKTTKDILQYFKPSYGIAFQMNNKEKNAYIYILSMLNPDDSEDIENDITNWKHAYNDPYGDCGTYKTGDFRNLYPLNFIGEAHLNRDVHGQTLRAWIESNPTRGTLEPLNEKLWTWEIPEDQIPVLREQLRDTDLLICFRDYE